MALKGSSTRKETKEVVPEIISIHGYVLDKPLSTNNSGFSKWGFGEKNGNSYFIKEFLSPVYPEDESIFTPKQLAAKKKGCATFEAEKKELYKRLNRSSDGNAVLIDEFFRYGSKYYIVMKKIRNIEVLPSDSYWNGFNRIICAMTLVHSLAAMHKEGVVHADLKWTNILFSQSCGNTNLVAKLIDFDNSFCTEQPPTDFESFNVDQVYCAPETFMFLNEEPVKLDEKIDIYALGILLHQIFSGKLPKIDSKYQYVYEAQLDNSPVELDPGLSPNLKAMIESTLKFDPKDRISCKEVMQIIKAEYDAVYKSMGPGYVNAGVLESMPTSTMGGYYGGGYPKTAPVPAPEPKPETKKAGDFFSTAGDF